MCGISGYIDKRLQPASKTVISSMNAALSHRGPDEEGGFYFMNIGLGHKRLSIIDLSSGQQPMKNDDGNLIISYNGELYNFIELRATLIKKGLKFHTNSDTEVILKSYEYYGNDCVNHFRGMFAFAIVNKVKNEVFIARDHLGIKPLVYYQDSQYFAFSSEINALVKLPNFNKEIDYYAIDQYLTYQYIPAPRTIFRKVIKLLPGHFMVVGFDGTVKSIKKYWDLEYNPVSKRKKVWEELVAHHLKESVRLHTVSDVDFGAFLSGGIDSTLVVKYMTEILGKGIKTYSIGFKDSAVNELAWADQVAKKYDTQHTSLTLEGNALELLPKIVRQYGEPFGDFSSIPTYYVSQIASKDVKMVLSGDGADEAFAGYSHYPLWLEFTKQRKHYFNNPSTEKYYPVLNRLFSGRYPKLSSPTDDINNFLRFRTRMPLNERENLWKPQYRFLLNLPNELEYNYDTVFQETVESSRSQYYDIKVFLPSDILTKVDIASMMNSLEVRTPITDVKIFEMAASIPPSLLYEKRGNSWTGKSILKKLLEPDFDQDFIYRKKQGFEIPLDKWLFEEDNYKYIEERFNHPRSILNELFEKEALNRILNEKKSYDIWLLLVLDEWFLQLNKTV
jgi:asparagine synthase (glutamine-hydrolysing)